MNNLRKIQMIAPFLVSIVSFANLHAKPIKVGIKKGIDHPGCIKLIFFAEGYTETDKGVWMDRVNDLTDSVFETTPFKEYSGFFKVSALWTVSQESGVPQGIIEQKDTYFKGLLTNRGMPRISDDGRNTLLGILADQSIVKNFRLSYDVPVILFNHDGRGASAPGMLFVNFNSGNPVEALIHEIGHIFANLADEYDYEHYDPPQEAPNVTAYTSRDSIRWRHWIEQDTPIPTPETQDWASAVGLFEGAAYQKTGWYRPKLNCLMNSFDAPFCEVCREELVRCILVNTTLVESVSPPPSGIIASEAIHIYPVAKDSAPFAITWFHDGTALSHGNMFTMVDSIKRAGGGNVSAIIRDTTGYLIDPQWIYLLADTMEWEISNSTSNHLLRAIPKDPISDACKVSIRLSNERLPSSIPYVYTLRGEKIPMIKSSNRALFPSGFFIFPNR